MRSFYALTLASALTLPIGSVAHAQRALGDGSALDSNLQQGSNGRNARARNFERELRLRNAIVTGHAAGGLSFRGDVGYGSVDDFRGELAEDDLFAFDRDSFLSAVTGQGVRGADALQMQMQLTIGGFVGEGDFLPAPIVDRAQSATRASNVLEGNDLSSRFGSSDPLQYRRGALRATSEFVAQTASEPVLLRVTPAEDPAQPSTYTVASPLRSMTEQAEPRPTRRLTDLYEQLERLESRDSTLAPSNRLDSETPETAHQAILQRLLERQQPAEVEDAQADPDDAEAIEAPRRGAGQDVSEEFATESELLDRLRELREDLMNPDQGVPEYGGSSDEEETEPTALDELRERIASDAERLFQGGSIQVDEIAPPARDEESLFASHMRRGQEQLASGEWFAAEERFTSALGLKPGDPMAAVGRVHAQIGGGFFLSAGLNLQKLFRAHPELVKVRYGASLLPLGDRLEEIEALLLPRLREDNDFSRGAAIVQAYLGFQSENDAWVERGLTRAREIDDALSRKRDALIDVLEQAWLAGDE